MTEIVALSAREIATRVRDGSLSALEATESALRRAEQCGDLGAFLSVLADGARARAQEIDERRSRGQPLGMLAGVPVALKDAICTKGAPTTAGSKILTRDGSLSTAWCPPYDATVVERLLRADAVVIGKTNLDEFAMGSSNENSAFLCAKNPWDETRTPGGSSGGSAVSVASSAVPVALGSDTGGSIRQPAAFTGVVGLKPSYGRVSRYGLVAFASSLDQIGPFSRDVRDAARTLAVIAGPDPRDSTCADRTVPDFEAACDASPEGLRIGVPKEYFAEGLAEEVRNQVQAGLARLERAGCVLVDVELPSTRFGVATYYVLATAEASSNLARFDGVRFGARARDATDLQALYANTRGRGFGPEVKRRILLGTYVLSAGYYDAYYDKARRVRELIRQDFARCFRDVDLIACPTSPTLAFPLGERVQDPLGMYLADVYTLPASLAGLAAISVPVGTAAATAERPTLPVGMQLFAPAFEECRMLTAAAAVETEFPFQPPPEKPS